MARLIQIQDGHAELTIRLDEVKTSIGRDESNQVCLQDALVSKHHAVIEIVFNEKAEGEYDYILQDLDSTNFTFVNDQKVNMHRLQHGDIIRIGTTNFRFDDSESLKPDETAKLHKTWIPGVYVTRSKKSKKKSTSKKK